MESVANVHKEQMNTETRLIHLEDLITRSNENVIDVHSLVKQRYNTPISPEKSNIDNVTNNKSREHNIDLDTFTIDNDLSQIKDFQNNLDCRMLDLSKHFFEINEKTSAIFNKVYSLNFNEDYNDQKNKSSFDFDSNNIIE